MALYERYELLELRRDDGIQTYHARDIETARPVQLHMFPQREGGAPEAAEYRSLLTRLEHLPDAERRRVIERGDYKGRTYVVTDRLAGYPGFREWLTAKTDPVARHSSFDDQFHQLFDPNAETAAQTLSPIAAVSPAGAVSPLAAPGAYVDPPGKFEVEEPVTTAPSPQRAPVVRKSLVGIALGILAAIVLLGLLVAGFAFLPR